jgi:hypothetical protein
MKHNVFISYHHKNDQVYKDNLVTLNDEHEIFIDCSVETGDIDDENKTDEQIREIIRDDYLKSTTVTLLLVGTETKNRKHIDWELYSSMYDGSVNRKSGILVINLPTITNNIRAGHGEQNHYPEITNWTNLITRAEYERHYPEMPARIIDNFLKENVKISVTNWDNIKENPQLLVELIDRTYNAKSECQYDLSRPMRRKNS